jgi:putative membrane protein
LSDPNEGKIMHKTLLAVTVVILAAGCARDRDTSKGAENSSDTVGGVSGRLAASDETFVREAGQSGMAEVKEGQLATKNSQNDAVRRYGQTLIADHTKANDELKQIVSRKGSGVSADLGKHQAAYDRLAALTGPEFDKAFKDQAIKDHEQAIRLFEQQAQQGSDPDLKAFAQKYLPHLRHHLTLAQQLAVGQRSESGVQPK